MCATDNRLINKLILALLVALLLPAAAAAQTSSVNAFSPYTMYGIGEMNTPGTLPMRSMGGVGVALRRVGDINLLNPASYSVSPQKSFLFDFGVEGQNYYNAQKVEGVQKKSAHNSLNFRDIALQLPITRKLGVGFSLTPYSSVGYRMHYDHPYDDNDPVWGNVGRVQYDYQGEGDVTEVKLGLGWEVFKNFSVGVALQYYWGDSDRDVTSTTSAISGAADATYTAIIGNDNYSVSRFKGQLGVQWVPLSTQKRVLTVGATYDFGGDLSPRVRSSITMDDVTSTVVRSDTTSLKLVLPHQVAFGLFYQTSRWALGADYVYQDWGGRNSGTVRTGVSGTGANNSYEVAYTNTHTIKLGAELTPSRYDVRHFLNRCSYRAGFRYGSFNQTFNGHALGEWAVTAGVGVPVQFLAVSGINVGFEYGRRGYNLAPSLGLVRQQYFKFALGFTLFGAGGENKDYWFVRPKYD